jgi:hypothetical protein
MKGKEGEEEKRNEELRIRKKMTILTGGQGNFADVHPPVWNGRT